MEISVNATTLLWGWLAAHIGYGLITHYLWLAKTRAYAKETDDEICVKSFAYLFASRMIGGLEFRIIEAGLYCAVKVVVCIVAGIVAFKLVNVKPWHRNWIRPANCVKKTCSCCHRS